MTMAKKQQPDRVKDENQPEDEDNVFGPEPEVAAPGTSVPLDHGWAWLILLGAVLVMGIFIGVMKASGILFVAFQQRFKATSSVTAFLSTTQNAAQSISAVFVMTIGVKLTSCRVLVFVGGVLISVSYVITAMAESIWWLLISYGVMLGIGSACIVPTTVSILGQYFDKRRGLANSVAVAGGSLGGLLLAPLITKLLDHFGYWGCMLILAGIHLHFCVSAALFRPVSCFKTQPTAAEKEAIKLRNRLSSDVDERLKNSDVRKSLLIKQLLSQDFSKSTSSVESEDQRSRSESLSVMVPIGKRTVEVESLLLGSVPSIPQAVDSSPFARRRTFTESSVHRIKKSLSNSQREGNKDTSAKYLSGSHMDIAGFIQSPNSSQTIQAKDKTNKTKTWMCVNLFDLKLLYDPLFLLMMLSFGLLCSGNLMAMIFVAPHATDLDFKPIDVATLITISSAIDLIARISIGILADLRWFRRSTIVGTCAVITGISSSFLELYTSFALMVMFGIILGTVSGAYFALYAVVIVDYMSVEKLQSVLGFIALSNGAFVAAGFYAMGYLRDVTGSYVASFHMVAAMTLTGAAILFILPLIEKWKKMRQKSKKAEKLEIVVEKR